MAVKITMVLSWRFTVGPLKLQWLVAEFSLPLTFSFAWWKRISTNYCPCCWWEGVLPEAILDTLTALCHFVLSFAPVHCIDHLQCFSHGTERAQAIAMHQWLQMSHGLVWAAKQDMLYVLYLETGEDQIFPEDLLEWLLIIGIFMCVLY